MTHHHDTGQLVKDISQLYASDTQRAEKLIEDYLENMLSDLSCEEKIKTLEILLDQFRSCTSFPHHEMNIDPEILSRIFSFLLGKKVTQADLGSEELLQRLAESLNTIFDVLNRLVSVINMTFLGRRDGIETIRQVIGFHLEGEGQSRSLESYLDQINKAFLIAQKAFKIAAEKKVLEILVEMDPEKMTDSLDKGFRLGKSRKAESFDLYTHKYNAFKNWFDSGRFMEELLREFENNCQRLFVQ
ncbi:MAG: hypothetical protein JW932_16135 [Deltaproteobacteria bacterium]|nr:hypothetical protein [Deltaproteobacteria bacterium]